MSKILDFFIEFDSKWGIYQPGEELTGKVLVNLADSIMCDSILLTIYGSARVLWIERKMYEGRFQPVSYRQEEVYVDHTKTVWEADPNDLENNRRPHGAYGGLQLFSSGGRLQKGKHKYRFSYRLPEDLPTSFEATGVPAFVRYFAKASMITNGCARVSKKVPFCVCSPVELQSAYPNSANPVRVEDTFALPKSRFPKIEGTVDVLITLPKSGYVPGEPIPIQVNLENNSTKPIKAVYASLRLRATVSASLPEFAEQIAERCLAENRTDCYGGSKNGELKRKFHQVECVIYIPAVSPNIRISGLLDTRYYVQIDVSYSKTRAPIVMRIPIVIGTVPVIPRTPVETRRQLAAANRGELLATVARQVAAGPDEEEGACAVLGTSPTVDLALGPASSGDLENRPPVPAYHEVEALASGNIPPPTYEESVMGGYEEEQAAVGLMSTSVSEASLPKYKVYPFKAV